MEQPTATRTAEFGIAPPLVWGRGRTTHLLLHVVVSHAFMLLNMDIRDATHDGNGLLLKELTWLLTYIKYDAADLKVTVTYNSLATIAPST